MLSISQLPMLLGALGLLVAWGIYRKVLAYSAGEGKVVGIADKIHRGAMVFMRTEYTYLAVFVAVVAALIAVSDLGVHTMFAFLVGALCSALAGYLGMYSATRANVRTTTAAAQDGASAALSVAFFGGSIMGLCVAAMGLIGLGLLYVLYGGDPHTAHIIHGFGMGASSVALFSRVGGGIFTKSADVGADLVGKVEAGIPEDDPRNPGVIADNVGDNVGDVAGMGSDIFESYCGSMIASIAIAATLSPAVLAVTGSQAGLMFLPLALASVGIVCSIAGIQLVRMNTARSPELALRIGTIGASLLFIVAALVLTQVMDISLRVWGAVLVGAAGGIGIGLITEYYTGGKPVRDIARSGETGPATVMINGLAVGMESVVAPLLIISAIILIASGLTGLYGVGIAAVGMLVTLRVNDPVVLAGIFLGGIFPFLVSSMTMKAVGSAAFDMIHEIRRQFREIPGLMEGNAEPDSDRCVDIATQAALKRMVAPGVLAVAAPVVVGFALGATALGGMLAGALLGCVLMALTMANAGGAWDNAKKHIEKGNLGGKGSPAHAAAVVGDTVGDPFKDTSGPSMNILINVMAIVSLVIAPLLGV